MTRDQLIRILHQEDWRVRRIGLDVLVVSKGKLSRFVRWDMSQDDIAGILEFAQIQAVEWKED